MIARRSFVLSALALLGLGIAGGVWVEAPRLLRKRLHSPYDDLLGQLPDQDQAAMVGKAVLADEPRFAPAKIANALRARPGTLADMAKADLAAGDLVEAQGWVLPRALAETSALLADQLGRAG